MTLSNIVVNVMGFGISTITPQVDQAPVTTVVSASTREDIGVAVTISGSDFDSNSLVVVLTALPNKGTLYTDSLSMTAVTVGASYYLPDGTNARTFYYVPNSRYSGTDSFTYYLNDGYLSSATATASLSVTFYNYAPTASNLATSTLENVNLTISLQMSDVEDVTSNLIAVISSLPDPTLGTLYHVNNKSAVQVNDLIAVSASQSVLFVPVTNKCCNAAMFTFMARDTAQQSSHILAC